MLTETEKGQTIARPVECLVSIRAIAAVLKAGQDTVRNLECKGVPIIRDRFGVARAEGGVVEIMG